ncbi:hypothetical protein [Mangrovibacterium diazotrophicum]|uniref:Outer membrane protein with beta-barrel domain n=1 Tax=Mangrovibacterium diazotrophicum TaxID=1261403 RepID=A0A419VUH6_9BACT|nr:hypothetical protein [Mangrovibacterium diazotrophicum]RKD85106.1 hypothetical protein BC643_4625 [Mangrovibacterium diazotrophicum]
MKVNNFTKALVCIALLIVSVTVSGQNRIIRNQGFYYTIEGKAGYGLSMTTDYPPNWHDEFSPFNLGLAVSANIFLNYHVSAGVSLGYNQYTGPKMQTLPFMGNLKYFFGKPARTPFIYAEGGYAFRTDADQQHKGLIYEAGLGYRHQMGRRHNFLMFKLGYNYFKANHWKWDHKPYTDFDDWDMQWYFLERPTINFTIAFYHSTRY